VKKAAAITINILAVFFIFQAAAVTVFGFAAKNDYREIVFGDTMLLPVGENLLDENKNSLAVVDMTGKTKGGVYFAVYSGNKVILTTDSLASVGKVRFFIPLLGGYISFLRTAAGFFSIVVLPLAALVIWRVHRLLFACRGGEREKDIES